MKKTSSTPQCQSLERLITDERCQPRPPPHKPTSLLALLSFASPDAPHLLAAHSHHPARSSRLRSSRASTRQRTRLLDDPPSTCADLHRARSPLRHAPGGVDLIRASALVERHVTAPVWRLTPTPASGDAAPSFEAAGTALAPAHVALLVCLFSCRRCLGEAQASGLSLSPEGVHGVLLLDGVGELVHLGVHVRHVLGQRAHRIEEELL